MAGKILVVDDEPPIREMIGFALSRAGYSYVEAADTAEAEAEIDKECPDLILMDWMLAGQSGIDFVRQLRGAPSTRSIPIIMLTARSEEDDKVRGLSDGADDYITKPFAPKELMARIEAVLRRVKPQATNKPVIVDGLSLDPVSHRVTVGERDLDLGPTRQRGMHLHADGQGGRAYGHRGDLRHSGQAGNGRLHRRSLRLSLSSPKRDLRDRISLRRRGPRHRRLDLAGRQRPGSASGALMCPVSLCREARRQASRE